MGVRILEIIGQCSTQTWSLKLADHITIEQAKPNEVRYSFSTQRMTVAKLNVKQSQVWVPVVASDFSLLTNHISLPSRF